MDWINVAPSLMSAIASIAAAIAAIGSLRVSREAKKVSEQNAYATHHGPAASQLSKAVDDITKRTHELHEIAYGIYSIWPNEIGENDDPDSGGSDPRPLRHVLINASELLVDHGISTKQELATAKRSMFSIIRESPIDYNEKEYNELFEQADREYRDFEDLFGKPSSKTSIIKSPAFRWTCYQLDRRISRGLWRDIWENAWIEGGWLDRYRKEHSSISPELGSALTSLKTEKAKLAHGEFPLGSNELLYARYDEFIKKLEVLLEDCSLDSMEEYKDWEFDEDLIYLIIYSIGIALLSMQILDSIRFFNE